MPQNFLPAGVIHDLRCRYLSNTATKFFIVLDHTPLRDDSVIAKVSSSSTGLKRNVYQRIVLVIVVVKS